MCVFVLWCGIEPDKGMEPGLAHHFFLQLMDAVVSGNRCQMFVIRYYDKLDCSGSFIILKGVATVLNRSVPPPVFIVCSSLLSTCLVL